MERQELLQLLSDVQSGVLSTEEALLRFREAPYTDLGYATIDHHRGIRKGVGEVVYGAGKTSEQICGIVQLMLESQRKDILITRMSQEAAECLARQTKIEYDPLSRICVVNRTTGKVGIGSIVIASGGTSDMPVCEEAALTAELLGNNVIRLYDVGVAGLHRLLGHLNLLMRARVVIAIAGMEGALASVIGGLVDCPVIAVPTSVGYGASFDGLAALLAMLNSCASGVGVVNIDNGFGAAYLASQINHMGEKSI
ncbi:MAG: nickel pincer cofactor biosynthesis protein LarB [Clostridia bacterium]